MILFMYFGFAVAAAGTIGGTIFLSKLIELEYARFYNSWLADGKPAGGKQSRKEASFWFSGFSRICVAYSWLFEKPGWVGESVEAQSLLKLYRLWTGAFAVGFATLMAIAFAAG